MQTLKELIQNPRFPQGSSWNPRQFHAGEIVVKQDSPALSVFLVQEGVLQIAGRIDLGGGTVARPALAELKAGDCFGEFSLFGQKTRTASIKALTDGTLAEIDTDALRRFMDKNPAFGYRLLQEVCNTLVGRLTSTNDLLSYVVSWGLVGAGEDSAPA